MGQCSTATLSYGFILKGAQLVKLLFACRKHDEPEGNFTPGSHQKTLKEGETEEVTTFLEAWTEGQEVAPFHFEVVSEETEGTGASGEPAFAIGAQTGKRGSMQGTVRCQPTYGVGGIVSSFFRDGPIIFSETTNIDGTSFEGLPQPMTDPKFVAEAQKAIKQLQESPLFKDAGLTEVTPQWILSLSIG